MQNEITVFMLLGLGLFGMWWGFGKLTGLWGGGTVKHEGDSTNTRRIISIIVIGLFALMWLAQPGADKALAGSFQAAINNLIIGIQPLVHFATELAALVAIGYIAFLFIRKSRRH